MEINARRLCLKSVDYLQRWTVEFDLLRDARKKWRNVLAACYLKES
jgi:hypothetical protein